MITPDLTPEEAGPWLAAAADHDLDRVFLVAPSSTPERIELITKVCAGFASTRCRSWASPAPGTGSATPRPVW